MDFTHKIVKVMITNFLFKHLFITVSMGLVFFSSCGSKTRSIDDYTQDSDAYVDYDSDIIDGHNNDCIEESHTSYSNSDVSQRKQYNSRDSIILCPACEGTGLSYETRQTNLMDRDMISASAGVDRCLVCLGEKTVMKSVAAKRWQAIMLVEGEKAAINERKRSQICSFCNGDGKCWQCKGDPAYKNSDCYCKGSGSCDICHGSGHF